MDVRMGLTSTGKRVSNMEIQQNPLHTSHHEI